MKIDFFTNREEVVAGLSWGISLRKRGKTVRIFDLRNENQSSRVAAVLFNPITGRKWLKLGKADQLVPENPSHSIQETGATHWQEFSELFQKNLPSLFIYLKSKMSGWVIVLTPHLRLICRRNL